MFKASCQQELFYVDDQVSITDSLVELERYYQTWKLNLEPRGPKVNLTTKVLVSRKDRTLVSSGKGSCLIYKKEISINVTAISYTCFICDRCIGAEMDSFKCPDGLQK